MKTMLGREGSAARTGAKSRAANNPRRNEGDSGGFIVGSRFRGLLLVNRVDGSAKADFISVKRGGLSAEATKRSDRTGQS